MVTPKRVVTIGAGTGMAQLLKGLRPYADFLELVAIVGVTDNGGHSGKIRQLLRSANIPAPQIGDGRKCILEGLALDLVEAGYFTVLPDGTNTANVFVGGLLAKGKTLAEAFAILAARVKAWGKVVPCTNQDVDLCAEFEGGDIITGEWEIIKYNHTAELRSLFLNRQVEASQAAIEAITRAEIIILGPGSLRTGIISALLPVGIKQAMTVSSAKMIFICNLMTQPGQTDGFTAGDHLSELEGYAGRCADVIILNSGSIPAEVLDHYANLSLDGGRPTPSFPIRRGRIKKSVLVVEKELIPPEELALAMARNERVGSFIKWTHVLTHESYKLAVAVAEIIGFKN